jgi:hypothetical protein
MRLNISQFWKSAASASSNISSYDLLGNIVNLSKFRHADDRARFSLATSHSTPLSSKSMVSRLTMTQLISDLTTGFLGKVMTLPYYRLYYFNTVAPIERIATLASQSPLDTRKVLRAIASWRARKLAELQFITISVRQLPLLQLADVNNFSVQC